MKEWLSHTLEIWQVHQGFRISVDCGHFVLASYFYLWAK